MKKYKNLLICLLLVLVWFVQPPVVAADDSVPKIGGIEAYQEINGEPCGFITGCSVANQDVIVKLNNIAYSSGTIIPDGTPVHVTLVTNNVNCNDVHMPSQIANGGDLEVAIDGGQIKTKCSYALQVSFKAEEAFLGLDNVTYISKYAPPVQASCNPDQCSSDLGLISSTLYKLCDQIKTGTPQHDACMSCFTGEGIWTAVGCVPSNPENIIQAIVSIGLAVGGGVVLIMILVGSFMLSVSQGDPNKTKEAKEQITSAVIGLLFIIFSVTILQFIGVSILHIPGFGE